MDGTLPRVQSASLDYYSGYLNEVDVNWRVEYPQDSALNRYPLEMFFKWRSVFASSTLHVFRYYEENNSYPIAHGNFTYSWKQVCSDAAESEATAYAETMCEMFVESAYIGSTLDEDSYSKWVIMLSNLREDHPDVVDAALSNLESEGRTGLMRYFTDRDQNPSGLINTVRRMKGSGRVFDEWIAEFEQDVYDE